MALSSPNFKTMQTMWHEVTNNYLNEIFPAVKFKVCVRPEEFDRVISIYERIVLFVDNCCDSADEEHGLLISNNQIAIPIYKKNKPAITLYDCIKAVENIGWKPKCSHIYFENVHKIESPHVLNLYAVSWGS